MKRIWRRLSAAALTLVLLLFPARALTVEEAKDLLQKYYVDPLPDQVLAADAMDELVDALGDPYAQYFTPEEYASFWDTMSDTSLVGIGVVASMGEDGLLVEEVLQDSPAQKGGLAVGDVIVKADGKDTAGQSLDTVVDWLRGEEGSQVKVTYRRDGRTHTVTLTRATVTRAATTGQLLDDHIGYIQCTTWGAETLGHFQDLLEEMRSDAALWVVDLRQNTGGLTDAAVDVAELFCGEGPILRFRYGDGSYDLFQGEAPAVTQAPLMVLVDEYTASASEAFCAAVRDYDRGYIIGERTYGKGVAQGVWDKDAEPELFPEGDAIKFTVARFFSPAGSTNDSVGVLPHLPVDGEDALDAACLLAQHIEEGVSLSDLAQELGLAPAPSPFPDLEGSPYADSVNALRVYRMVEGNEQGQFLPKKSLTRGELCQILYRALQCDPPEGESAFSDVSPDAWYADAVNAVAQWGLVEGDGAGLFHPEDVLDHQQLITILGRLAAWLNCDLADQAEEVTQEELSLRVLRDYAHWAKPSVWLLSSSQETDDTLVNLLWEEPELIQPTAPATREEAADLLYSVLSYLCILP